jgi:hypothetical protein
MTTPSPVLMFSLASALLLGCAEPTRSGSSPDAPTNTADAPIGAIMLPRWSLEDVQPASARVGQTYGLDTFTGKIIVVSLLEGF